MNNAALRLGSSIRNKMIVIFFLIIIVPFLLFAYYAHIKSIEGITNANAAFSMSYLQQAKTNFETYLNQLNDQVNEIIGNKQIQDLLGQKPGKAAQEEAFAVNMLTELYLQTPLVDAFRVRVYPLEPSLYPTYMSTIGESPLLGNERWFQYSKSAIVPSWNLFMPQQGRYTRPLLSYIKRFSGLYDQIPRGIIVTDLSEDQMKRFFSPSEQMKGQKFLLMNNAGAVLYDSQDNQWTGSLIPSANFTAFIKSKAEGSETILIDGERNLVTYIQMDSEPWLIVSLTPLHELTKPIQEMNRLLIFFLIIYLICCFGAVIYITMYFTQPIAKLVRFMRKLETGDFQFTFPGSSRRDEVGWLYRGFGDMSQKIEGLIEQASQSERKKKELEFQVLSHQINPHFLYNTLESIRWKAENHGRSDISEMVSALGNLLRLSLNQGKEITTLGREIEQVKAYVQIEQARMGQPVRILYAFDEETLALPFLRLLLQPLVENAIQHSIRDNFEKGKIVVSGRREGQDIVIEIADNGKGIPSAVLVRLQDQSEQEPGRRGVGLRNVNDRLRLYYGDHYKLQIETGPEFGTKITVRSPIASEQALQGGNRQP
ncbi:sensor histidine kinase [Paenibacillus solisilvae]|uniref:histidine kinase n=1 Tax=Paenibacillus solisilvae TaxID=2486751 RepID=A0ABW0VRP1_9BACL